jgi:hypothetical protein
MSTHNLVILLPFIESIRDTQQVVARDCVQDAGEKFKESAMFYATARQRNAEKEMSEATLRKMHRKALPPATPVHPHILKCLTTIPLILLYLGGNP